MLKLKTIVNISDLKYGDTIVHHFGNRYTFLEKKHDSINPYHTEYNLKNQKTGILVYDNIENILINYKLQSNESLKPKFELGQTIKCFNGDYKYIVRNVNDQNNTYDLQYIEKNDTLGYIYKDQYIQQIDKYYNLINAEVKTELEKSSQFSYGGPHDKLAYEWATKQNLVIIGYRNPTKGESYIKNSNSDRIEAWGWGLWNFNSYNPLDPRYIIKTKAEFEKEQTYNEIVRDKQKSEKFQKSEKSESCRKIIQDRLKSFNNLDGKITGYNTKSDSVCSTTGDCKKIVLERNNMFKKLTIGSVAAVILLAVGAGVWHSPIMSNVRSSVKNATEWTPQAIQNNPNGYLDYSENCLEQAISKLKEAKIGNQQTNVKLAKELKKINQYLAMGEEKINYISSDTNRNVSKANSLVYLKAQYNTNIKIQTKLNESLERVKISNIEIEKRVSEYSQKLIEIKANRENVKITKMINDLEVQIVDVDEIVTDLIIPFEEKLFAPSSEEVMTSLD